MHLKIQKLPNGGPKNGRGGHPVTDAGQAANHTALAVQQASNNNGENEGVEADVQAVTVYNKTRLTKVRLPICPVGFKTNIRQT